MNENPNPPIHRGRAPRPTGHLVGLIACVAVAVFALSGGPVSAHSDLSTTSPAANEVVAQPITQITLTFKQSVTAPADAFSVVGPDGVIQPSTFASSDGQTYVVTLANPLPNGSTTVNYSVVADNDGHLLSNKFAFTVDVAEVSVTTNPPTTPAPTQPVATQPVATQPAATQPVAAQPVTPSTLAAVPVATSPASVTADPAASGPLTDTTDEIMVAVAAIALGVLGARYIPQLRRRT